MSAPVDEQPSDEIPAVVHAAEFVVRRAVAYERLRDAARVDWPGRQETTEPPMHVEPYQPGDDEDRA